MSRALESWLLFGAAALAALGVAMVNLAIGGTVDASVGLAFLMFGLGFGAFQAGVRRFAPRAVAHLLPPVALLAAIGLIEVTRIDPARGTLQRWWLLIAAAIGVGALAALARWGLEPLRRYRYIVFLLTLALLLLPLLPTGGSLPVRGLVANGSRLWIVMDVGFSDLHFQPGEIAKVLLVSFLAAYLADRQSGLTEAHRRLGRLHLPEPRLLVPLLVVWLGSMLVLVSQRDLGASLLLLAVFVGMLYAATGRSGYVLTGMVLGLAGGVAAWSLFSHVRVRVEAWLNPFSDFTGSGYQIAQGLFALGTGSLSGSGPGVGRPDLIPNAATDFVFAAVGEEFGFAGTVAVLAAYALIVAAGFGIALRARDRFRKLLAVGLTFAFAFQTFLILGGILRLVPLTGITLPFMSYGGSSLVGNVLLVALLLRVSHEEAT